MAPIKTFQVENVQSIKDLTLTFDKSGIFYISGGNNIGKSALTQILAVHFNNISNNQYKEMLRDGTDYFKTTLTDYDGNWTTLSRGAVDYYEWSIDGVSGRLDKTQGKVPEILKEYFNLYEDSYDKENLNIRNETSPILFSRTPGTANFRYLQEALGVDAYHKGAKEAAKSQREQKTLEKAYQQAVDDDQGDLERREATLAGINSDYKMLNTMSDVLDGEVNNLKLLSDAKDLLLDIQQNERLTSAVGTFIQMDFDELRELLEKFQLLSKCVVLLHDITALNKTAKLLKPLAAIDTDDLNDSLDTLTLMQKLTNSNQLLMNYQNEMSTLKPVASLELDELETQVDTFGDLTLLVNVVHQVNDLKKKEDEISGQLKQKEQEEQDFLDQFDICPFCQQPIDHNHPHNGSLEMAGV